MRPSEVKRKRKASNEAEKPIRASAKANPPISREEAEAAGFAICPWHGGLIAMTGDVDGAVHYCPVGKMHWRYRAKPKSHGRLPQPSIGVIRL